MIPCSRLPPETMDIALFPRKEGPRSWCCHLPNEETHRKLKGESLYPGDRGSERSSSYWVVTAEESGRWFSQWLQVWTPIIKKAGSPCRSAQPPHLHSSCFMHRLGFCEDHEEFNMLLGHLVNDSPLGTVATVTW